MQCGVTVTSCHVTSCEVMQRGVLQCNFTVCGMVDHRPICCLCSSIILCDVAVCGEVDHRPVCRLCSNFCSTISRNRPCVMSCGIVLCCVILYCVVFCRVILYCAMLHGLLPISLDTDTCARDCGKFGKIRVQRKRRLAIPPPLSLSTQPSQGTHSGRIWPIARWRGT
jgi:hypothetical protein